MLELLFIGFLVGVTGVAARSGGNSDEDDNDKVDLTKFNNDLFKPGNHRTHTRYWENSSTGDYIKHTIDIDMDD